MERSYKIRLLEELNSGIIDKEKFEKSINESECKEVYFLPFTACKLLEENEQKHPGTYENCKNGKWNLLDKNLLFAIADCFQSQKSAKIAGYKCRCTLRNDNDAECKKCPAYNDTTDMFRQ